MWHGERQLAGGRNQRSEIRRQKSGVKLISDLRLLTSVIDDCNGFYDFSFLSALFNAAMCTSPAKCTGLLPCIGSQPEGSAEQKNCVSRPMRTAASSTGNPSTRLAASQVAPQGAPRHTWMRSILPVMGEVWMFQEIQNEVSLNVGW
jgi:hypothetical protein